MELLNQYFPALTVEQQAKFASLDELYKEWNARINVISRKDIDQLSVNHVLHSLAIARVQEFLPGSQILDVGTGGGFPGIPLAILFPETEFFLIDVILKKTKVVQAIADELGLKNVVVRQQQAQAVKESFDFIVSRAVTNMPDFVDWVGKKVKFKSDHERRNGILYLKGGDLKEELRPFPKAQCFPISDWFSEPFFETKQVVYLGL
ncbi:MAG: 16S rRNA (guanine(527)-N(7))-methyltransferase RsmG [Flavobacterium sp. BFFFF2]|nr:MAG: 16S rRNA (guanine(527)-N(7))-methyltransferase RsmG [Flavobacterium sp. BFFFF2]